MHVRNLRGTGGEGDLDRLQKSVEYNVIQTVVHDLLVGHETDLEGHDQL